MGEPSTIVPLSGNPQAVFEAYRAHASGLRIHTDTTIQATLLALYPSRSLASTTCDLIKYAQAGHATATLADDIHPTLRSLNFKPTAGRTSDGRPAGKLEEAVFFGCYDYLWYDHRFQVFVAEGQAGRCDERRCYVLSQASDNEGQRQTDSEQVKMLVLAASLWLEQSHNEVWVYDRGRWSKDKELWQAAQTARWEDVILDDGMKTAIMRDVAGFFDVKHAYAELGTPWKVGYLQP